MAEGSVLAWVVGPSIPIESTPSVTNQTSIDNE